MRGFWAFFAIFERFWIELKRYAFNTVSGLVTLYLIFLLIFAGAKYAQGFGINLFGESLEGLVLVFWCGPLLFLPIPIFPGPLCGRPSRGRWNSSTCARSVFVS